VTVIPFGLNRTVPDTALTPAAARERLGLAPADKVLLFFGNIAPYKGVEYLVQAFLELASRRADYRLVIAGRPKGSEAYWADLERKIQASAFRDRFRLRIEFVPDAETEIYFKGVDILILPYRRIFQSGVLFLGYNFGLPCIAAEVGSLKEEIVEGRTGWMTPPEDVTGLIGAIERHFDSELYAHREVRRSEIRAYAQERYSWAKVAALTADVYAELAPPR
jgi:glycosyltransferase involved in cell wall biosynthesis